MPTRSGAALALKTYTVGSERRQPLRLILEKVQVETATSTGEPPGTVLEANGERLGVATGEGTLAIELIQPAGKRALSTAEFLRG